MTQGKAREGVSRAPWGPPGFPLGPPGPPWVPLASLELHQTTLSYSLSKDTHAIKFLDSATSLDEADLDPACKAPASFPNYAKDRAHLKGI